MDKEIIIAIIASVFGSTGFWALITAIWQTQSKKRSAESKLLLGLAHDRICFLGSEFIKRGYVTRDEFENLHDYLFLPYQEMGGNGTAAKIMEDVKKLPIRGGEKT
jgi:hypothetical protein